MLEKTVVWLPVLALCAGFGLDILLGDPRWLPHPVRAIGSATAFLEKLLRYFFKKPTGERFAGIVIVLCIAGGSFLITHFALKLSGLVHAALGFLLAGYIYYAMFAVKDMVKHVGDVKSSLEKKDLSRARKCVGSIVSRDTHNLAPHEIARASLESLFENTADGVVAPLFYAALGGPALLVFYKAVNTLDSMLGYKNPRYFYLGWAAARLDDLLSFVPARLAALAYLAVGSLKGIKWKELWLLLCRDGSKHESPNSAWPEVAAAGVLGLRLGGLDFHEGQAVERPLLNEAGKAPGQGDLQPAISLFYQVCFLAFCGMLLVALVVRLLMAYFYPGVGIYW
ncbi:MAG: adenosylcobinamide-phosphate synthase CbiB [Bacillota bacterium]